MFSRLIDADLQVTLRPNEGTDDSGHDTVSKMSLLKTWICINTNFTQLQGSHASVCVCF